MGKLVWAAIGFAAAAILAEYVLPIQGLPYLAAALALLSAPVLLRNWKYRRQAGTVFLSACLGFLCWWGWYELHVAPCEALAGQTLTVTARVTDYPQVYENYSRVTARVLDGAPRERAYLYLYHEELPPMEPGDIIVGEIRTSSVTDRGGTRMHTFTSAGVSLRGYFRGDIEITGHSAMTWLYFPQRISRFVKERCETLFPGEAGVFMKALLTGDKQDLYEDEALYGDMRAAGMLHAVAVSGMHVMVIVNGLGYILGKGKRTSLAALPVMAVFCLMAGGGASVVRASLMQAVFMAAPLFGRESDGPSGIAAALLAILLINPLAIGGVGFQLSFLCIAGFAVFGDPMHEWARRRGLMEYQVSRTLTGTLISTLCATAFSIPVSAYYFGVIPLLSLLSNLLTLPVIIILFAGGYAICALSAVSFAGAAMLGEMFSWGVRWCRLVYRAIGNIPIACLYTVDRGAVAWLVFAYGLFLGWLLLRRRKIRIKPILPVLMGLIGLFAVFLGNAVQLDLGRREISALDVGQGQCVVLLDKSSAVVIDCGGSELQSAGDTAADWLFAAGKRRVDALILTHLHEDHTNGVEALLARMPVNTLILPADADDQDERLRSILAAAEENNTDVLLLSESRVTEIGDLALTLLLPQAGSDENERGIVTYAEYPGHRALIMGDGGMSAELALIDRNELRDVDILVAGHHGSKTASGALFLRLVQAETAVVSAGYNPYGLPAEETLDRLERYCGEVLRTDEMGTVTINMKETG